MAVWQEKIAGPLSALHLGSIRNQVLVFAVLAAFVPTLVTTLDSYGQHRQALTDKLDLELRRASADAARETDAWLDQRLDHLRTAARSYIISENLARTQRREAAEALARLRDYLNSVRERFPEHEVLVLSDATGRVVTNTSGRTGGLRLSQAALNTVRAGDAYVGEPYWDAGSAKPAMVLAIPIREDDGRLLAALTARLSLTGLAEALDRLAPSDSGDVSLMTDQGTLVISSRGSSAELMRTRLPDTVTQALLDEPGGTVTYRRPDGEEVVAALQRVPQLRWAAVAELPRAEALRQLGRLRSRAVWTIIFLVAAVAVMVGVLHAILLRPLERLAAAATKAAAGDLSVELPPGGVGEVGRFTRSFNTLLGRLRERESAGELERLSVTDALTGLYNRRHLMGTLASEAQRARRLRRPFSVLLMDVDHFKRYNDTQGHLAGDAALTKLAEILRKQTRAVDCVARYGGEEFLVVLLETTVATAALVAERIRSRVAAEPFGGGRMTVSIGVAECPAHGDTPEALIASADGAMYQAKAGGRDRVVAVSGKEGEKEKEPKRRRKGEA